MKRPHALELAALTLVLVVQAVLFARPIHSATNYDEDVYVAAVDALRHGQSLGSQVFAAQFPASTTCCAASRSALRSKLVLR